MLDRVRVSCAGALCAGWRAAPTGGARTVQRWATRPRTATAFAAVGHGSCQRSRSALSLGLGAQPPPGRAQTERVARSTTVPRQPSARRISGTAPALSCRGVSSGARPKPRPGTSDQTAPHLLLRRGLLPVVVRHICHHPEMMPAGLLP